MALFMGLAAGSALFGAISGKQAGDAASANNKATAAYNAEAKLANGRIQAETIRFNAIAPAYQARLDSLNSRSNALIYSHNAEVARFQGEAAADQYVLSAGFAMRDAAEESEILDEAAYESARSRGRANDQVKQGLERIERSGRQARSQIFASYASMGIAMDADAVEAMNRAVGEEAELKVADMAFEARMHQLSEGSKGRQASQRASRARRQGLEQAAGMEIAATSARMDADSQADSFEREAASLLASADYMDWYSGFIEDSAEVQAKAARAGAQIDSDNTFMAGSANASAAKARGNAALVSGIGQAASIGYQASNQD